MTKIVVALSGGVDSSVAAALLVEQGFDVTGVTMRLWSEPGCEQENRCCTPETRQIAKQVADKLNIPFKVLDAEEVFRKQVVQSFLDGYQRGETPNPCIFCNRYVKWGFLLSFAESIGAPYIATGHYARVTRAENGLYELWKGVDPSKDQAYMLSMLNQELLSHSIFPLGNYYKTQIRQLARELDLPAADQPESQDLCFLGKSDYRVFLRKYVPQVAQPGLIENQEGMVLGEHQGLAFYTIGQRKGLPSSTRPLYVLEKKLSDNVLIVGFEEELGKEVFEAYPVNWIAGEIPSAPMHLEVKIRFKAQPAPALVTPKEDGSIHVQLSTPLRDISAGQMAVLYRGEQVTGGGLIR
ncbi:MAG: tRNA 2-thiouridine(34) synthase MnmA [Anaerolineaceae bacterium]